ncbi:P-loop containing nucleoside triphosphate hydrolase protein [Aspergillus saccharolyticus JOP 1030-1]|uniref:P-loop containing nucleoside triphosphate hydrolase protein n=1 Tax=Aspergillus saccharolyticus JOP 1030-1 TaxID=1450539 RepID=A0A318Z6K2_9EURO|nr:P-loop containing nucleoside triphosphate hydrolase protein [Aspergillus saccharolyticus JOP 1030-1]PYH42931.1 P-loop containing nucleoside triphosphate hydrolase protein [Aspergillus saccharolyticus JOP 1030-1]
MSAIRTRSDRQKKYLQDVIAGKHSVQNVNDFKGFVEAILAQNDHSVAVERLMASPGALTALHKGLRFNTTSDFINQYKAKLLQYLSDPGIKTLLDVTADAQTMVNDGSLFRSPSFELRGLGHKLNHFLQMKCSGNTIDPSAFTAGGRHDNDFFDFRKIAILPTSDEFSCTERPFPRRADDDVQIANGRKKGRKSTFRLRNLSVARLSYGRNDGMRLHACCLGQNRNFVKHQAFGCLTRGAEIVAFVTIERDEDALLYSDVHFILVETPMFAYEPILKCLQETVDIPLTEELFLHQKGQSVRESDIVPLNVTNATKEQGVGDIQSILGTSKPVRLDPSQLESLLAGLIQRVSLIQGPPGTGKSFIGGLLTKVLHDHTNEKILFLEDLLDIGINPSGIPLSLFEQRSSYKRSQESWNILNKLKSDAHSAKDALNTAFSGYRNLVCTSHIVMDYLEFEEPDIYDTLALPEEEIGMTTFGSGGHAIGKDYLYARWVKGMDAGVFANCLPDASHSVWEMSKNVRNEKRRAWEHAILDEQISTVKNHAAQFNQYCSRLENLFGDKTRDILRSKCIIDCTTTAAAKYSKDIRNAKILNSHVLAALAPKTKQLVLIGDHLQLRPKINEYALIIEKGDGYNLNVSLFERLIHVGYPHATLLKQHRMCPEISALVQRLTYPNLENDRKTMNCPRPRGLQDRVIFFQHEHPELSFTEVTDKRDEGSKQSKKNIFEAEIVLQIVKYLGQQGYGTDKLVVLTPYLGQLHLLRETLSKQNDPVRNDLNSYELVKAGFLSQAGANHSKRRIKLSTIDNYQGEECEIVIASLTRSNKNGDIGFMAASQRLNVLLSRARNVLIIVGNANTFVSSRKGESPWRPFMDHLKSNGHLYEGLPVKCEQHPQKTAILKTMGDFESECPDGGCPAPCSVKLRCGIHECPSRCHQLVDHFKMTCTRIIEWTCSRGHRSSQACAQIKGACRFCNEEIGQKNASDNGTSSLKQREREKAKGIHRQLAEAQDEIAHLKQQSKEARPSYIQTAFTTKAPKAISDTTTKPIADEQVPQGSGGVKCRQNKSATTPSAAKDDWEYQKKLLDAQSREIDTLMELIGLESIKEKFLTLKAKVDVCFRQGVDLQTERFGSVLLGNPGTGKTTVARLYARFLASVGIIPGDTFIETTGSKLANDGVSGCQKTLEKILSTGGGALFIDEAYQLAHGSSFGGTQVLDFLLAEDENLTGKIKFFSHNPGFPSRFPHELKFNDYDDNELLKIFDYIEDGPSGLYSRGREGFANARAIENIGARIAERQSERLKRERPNRVGQSDDFLLTEDLIGPDMIGLGSVKTTVQSLLDSIQYNHQRELQELPPVEFTLARVFLGSPGTGITTVAKLCGQILVDIGILSNGEVVVKNPSDFVGSVIGESEKNTKGILASTLGKVLVIDEAYGLFAGGTSDGTSAKSDPYRSSVVDTIVAEVQSTAGEDQCVLLLGYREPMQQMFQNVNPGLSRRFPLDQALEFQGFAKGELDQILTMKLKEQRFNVTERGRRVALDMLERARNRPIFGNAGEVNILLNSAKMQLQKRISCARHAAGSLPSTLDAEDFDEDFDRSERDDRNVARLFEGVIGCDEIIAKLEGYRQIVRKMRQLECDPRNEVPFNFLFRGPPGTGKTSTARKLGQIYYDMGLLASADIIEISTTDLVGQYEGQTGPKTQQTLERALSKVLFVDEAYRPADGKFAQQAMDQIVDRITKPQSAQRLIIILAGYNADINHLMTINPGLASRFPDSFQKKDTQDKSNVDFDLGVLEQPRDDFHGEMSRHFNRLSRIATWANARDVDILAKDIFRKVLQNTNRNGLVFTEPIVLQCLDQMVTERLKREQCQRTQYLPSRDKAEVTPPSLSIRVKSNSSSNTNMAMSNTSDATTRSPPGHRPTDIDSRDTDVTDEVWSQLQQDMVTAEARDKEYLILKETEETKAKALRKAREEEDLVVREVEEARQSGHEETRARHEQARVQRELERRAQEEELEKIRKQREQMEQNRR